MSSTSHAVRRIALACLATAGIAAPIAGCGSAANRHSEQPAGGAAASEVPEPSPEERREEIAETAKNSELLSALEAKKREEAAEAAAKRTEKRAATKAKKREEAAEKDAKKREAAADAKAKQGEEALKAAAKKEREEAERKAAAKKKKQAEHSGATQQVTTTQGEAG